MINFEQYLLERKGSSAGQQTKRKVNIEQLKEMISNKDPEIADVDVSEITNMSYLFEGSDFGGSWSADLRGWDTSSVEDMNGMFARCSELTKVEFSNTEKVEYMANMFKGCTSLREVSLPHTEKVEDMFFMFHDCTNLTKVELPHTENVVNMTGMFSGCTTLTKVEIPHTENVENMQSMFASCTSLKEVTLPHTKKVTNMYSMFKDCEKLEQNFSSWDVRGIVRTSMFEGTKVTKFPEGYEQ